MQNLNMQSLNDLIILVSSSSESLNERLDQSENFWGEIAFI